MDDLDVDFCECPICLDIFKDASNLRRCGHDFCNSCISRWLSTNNTCPVCRDRADPGDVLPSRLLRIFFSFVNLHAAATESDAAKRLRIKETHEFLVQFMGALSVEERRIMGINRRQTGHPLVMMQPITPHVDMMHGSAVNSRAQIPPTHSHMQQEQEQQYQLNMGPSLVTQPYNDSTNAMVYYGVSTDDAAQLPHNHFNMQHQQPQYHTNFEHSYHPSHQLPQITHTPPPRVIILSSSHGPGNTASNQLLSSQYPFGREYHRDYQQQQRRRPLNLGPLPPPQMQHHRHNNSPHHQLPQASPLSPSYPPLPPRDNPSITNSLRGEYNDYGGRRSSRNPTGREHRHQDHNRSRSRSRSG
eukprot:scaffold10708_cov164-Skeletonema_menzelii.AAC.5